MVTTSAGSSATCSAETISPRAAPAYPMFTRSRPALRAAMAGQAWAGLEAIHPWVTESP